MPTPIPSLSNLLQLLQLSHVKKRIKILKCLAWQLHQEHQQREAVIFADTAHFILVAAVLPKIQPAATVTKSDIGKRFAGAIHIKLQLQLLLLRQVILLMPPLNQDFAPTFQIV